MLTTVETGRAFHTLDTSPFIVEGILLKIRYLTREHSSSGILRRFAERESAVRSLLSFVAESDQLVEMMLVELEETVATERELADGNGQLATQIQTQDIFAHVCNCQSLIKITIYSGQLYNN